MKKMLLLLTTLIFLTACSSTVKTEEKINEAGTIKEQDGVTVIHFNNNDLLAYTESEEGVTYIYLNNQTLASEISVSYLPLEDLVRFEYTDKDGYSATLCNYDTVSKETAIGSQIDCEEDNAIVAEAVVTAYKNLLSETKLSEKDLLAFFKTKAEQ